MSARFWHGGCVAAFDATARITPRSRRRKESRMRRIALGLAAVLMLSSCAAVGLAQEAGPSSTPSAVVTAAPAPAPARAGDPRALPVTRGLIGQVAARAK